MNARSIGFLFLMSIALFVSFAGTAHAGRMSPGIGIHYLRNLGDISNDPNVDLNENSASLIGSLKSGLGPITVDGQVEYIFDYIGTGNEMWQPSVWGLLGNLIYGGVGMGIGYTDGDWQTNPFYALRAGVNLPLGKRAIDLYGTYNFQSDQELENLTGEDLDSVTFAAVLHF